MFIKAIKKEKEMGILLFAVTIISVILFHDFIFGKKLLIFNDVGCDTYNQYWPALQFVVHSIHNGTFKSWLFEAGMGTDIFSIISYFLDPFHFFLVFLPERFVPYGIGMAYIIKIYFCAVFEYKYLKKINIASEISAIISIIWAFSSYMVLWGQHYQFGSAMALFTAIMYGLECLITEKRSGCFTVSLILLMIYSPYFSYQIVIFVLIYYILRYFTLYSFSFKDFVIYLYHLLWIGVISVGIASVTFIPNVEAISASSRYGNAFGKISILGNLKSLVATILKAFSANILGSRYHKDILGRNYYATPLLASSVLCFLFSIEYFLKVKNKNKKIVWGISAIIFIISILTGVINYIMNGFTAVGYVRWSYMLIFTLMLNTALCMQAFQSDNSESKIRKFMPIYGDICFLALFASMVYIFRYYKDSISDELIKYAGIIIFGLSFFALLYCVIFQFCNFQSRTLFWILLIIVSIELSWTNYDTVNNGGSLSADYLHGNEGYFDYTSKVVEYLNTIDDSTYRIEKMYRTFHGNDSFMQNYKGTYFYGMVRNGYFNFMDQLGYVDPGNPNRMYAINNSSQIESIAGIKYILSKEPIDKISYEYVNKVEDIYIYKNNGCYSIGYTVDSYLLKDDFEKMSLAEKQDNLLQSVVLESRTDKLSEQKIATNILDFSMQKADNQIEIFITPQENNGIELIIPVSQKNNSYIEIYKDNAESQNLIASSTLSDAQDIYEISLEQADINHLVLLSDDSIDESGITIFARSNSEYEKNSHDQMQITNFTSTNIEGTIDCSADALLVFSIPDYPGWKVKVDGIKAEKVNVNYGFWGTYLSAGSHNITITYFSPYLLVGCIISIITIISLIIGLIIHKLKKSDKEI